VRHSLATRNAHEEFDHSVRSGRTGTGPDRVRLAYRNHYRRLTGLHQSDRLEGQRLLQQLEQQLAVAGRPRRDLQRVRLRACVGDVEDDEYRSSDWAAALGDVLALRESGVYRRPGVPVLRADSQDVPLIRRLAAAKESGSAGGSEGVLSLQRERP